VQTFTPDNVQNNTWNLDRLGLFQIFMIMTATLSRVVTGEWKGAPASSKLLLTSGLVCLAVATTLLAMGNW
jgi:hypothetical protein